MTPRPPRPKHVNPSDIYGASKLMVDATLGITSMVEAMHENISNLPGVFGAFSESPTTGITGFVYRSIKDVTRVVGGGLDMVLGQLAEVLSESAPSSAHDSVVAALNGMVGDHLAASSNPLAITMQFRKNGAALTLNKKALAQAIPDASGRILLLIHGLCMSYLQWQRNGHDHGEALATDPLFTTPFTNIYLHYNSGLHISDNGHQLAEEIEALLKAWPVPVRELTVIAHSMGGLVTRSACDVASMAKQSWPRKLKNIIFLGTPHFGAPLARSGNWVNVILDTSPYTAALAGLAKVRSAGITDLRRAGVRDADWVDQDRFARKTAEAEAVPLPKGVTCYAMAACMGDKAGSLKDELLGDGLVPVSSALGEHNDPTRALAFAKTRQWTGYEMNHMDLLDNRKAYLRMRKWLSIQGGDNV